MRLPPDHFLVRQANGEFATPADRAQAAVAALRASQTPPILTIPTVIDWIESQNGMFMWDEIRRVWRSLPLPTSQSVEVSLPLGYAWLLRGPAIVEGLEQAARALGRSLEEVVVELLDLNLARHPVEARADGFYLTDSPGPAPDTTPYEKYLGNDPD